MLRLLSLGKGCAMGNGKNKKATWKGGFASIAIVKSLCIISKD